MKDLSFRGLTILRRLTLSCWGAYEVLTFDRSILARVLRTIQSPLFCELVFEVPGPSPDPRFDLDMGTRTGIDAILREKFAEREDCRLIFRIEEADCREIFQRDIMDGFPKLRERGRIHFE